MVRLAVAYSLGDPAGRGSALRLVELFGGSRARCPYAEECFEVNGVMVGGFNAGSTELEMLDASPDPNADAVVVFSRHRAESGRKSLTVHHPGNPTSDNSLGGEPMKLATSYPALAKALLVALRDASIETGLSESHEVTLEATHHGPTKPSKPIVYMELGSTEEDWSSPRGWETIALAFMKAMDILPKLEGSCVRAAGFGGTHYVPKHTKLQLESSYCIGHTIPRYAFDKGASESIIEEALTKAYPGPVEIALVEKKSLKGHQRRLVASVCERLGVRVEYI